MRTAALLVLAVLSGVPAAAACDCAPLKPISKAIRAEAPYIFEGQVVEIIDRTIHTTRTTPGGSTGETRPLGREIVFQVTRAWAGATARRMSIFADDSDCAYTFEAGKRYVVFAKRDAQGRPTTSVCMRTSDADHAEAVIRALGRATSLRRGR
jgi:hypothetical protein